MQSFVFISLLATVMLQFFGVKDACEACQPSRSSFQAPLMEAELSLEPGHKACILHRVTKETKDKKGRKPAVLTQAGHSFQSSTPVKERVLPGGDRTHFASSTLKK